MKRVLFSIYLAIILMFPIRPLSAFELSDRQTEFFTNVPEDAQLNFTQIANKYGYKCDEYRIVTEDNYILTLFNIPGNRSRPVFLMHGLLDSADTFIIRANNSISLTMARERNNDVWVGNMRGNKYSRDNLLLNPNIDKKFWDFSFHEIAYYDMPAMIDFILEKTGQSQLPAIGHSLGTTLLYVLCITRPEYNDKIKVFISLAPIAFLQNIGEAFSTFLKFGPALSYVNIGPEEILGGFGEVNDFLQIICSNKLVGYLLCAELVFFQIDGPDREEIGKDFIPIAVGHLPAGTSKKNFLHIGQLSRRKKFAQYDYGLEGNLNKYKSTEPPEYDLSKVTMRIGLFVGQNDRISTIADTELLIPYLRNIVEYHIMARKEANHFDFVWAEHMYRDLFPYIFQLLDKYN